MRIINEDLTPNNAINLLVRFYHSNKGFIWFLLALFFIRSTFINWNYIPSASMNPNLIEGDYVLVNKLAFDIKIPYWGKNIFPINNPQRGDIVAFDNDGNLFVKRVMAIPGDTVQVINNNFHINGSRLPLKATTMDIIKNKELPYSSKYSFSASQETNNTPAVKTKSYNVIFASDLPDYIKSSLVTNSPQFTVPTGKYFMIGDTRNMSHDSRYFGTIEREKIVGSIDRVLFNYQQLWNKVTQQKTIDKLRLWQQINP
ncbi:signal peptidase I [Colwellia sp. BRX9-1]|uniref:signal peptidase I n=1 Tax=Colwellia sp. BRX9-1 TaxID=2759830 RepID=UPI0015F3558F|nr:signal peptidase I [Colwellia sp. BRX9-1]MBA6352714.1 signal peptidase I [Colwellia sp. BRX9-1]